MPRLVRAAKAWALGSGGDLGRDRDGIPVRMTKVAALAVITRGRRFKNMPRRHHSVRKTSIPGRRVEKGGRIADRRGAVLGHTTGVLGEA